MTTVLDALHKGTEYLEKKGVDGARLSMQGLLAMILGCDRMQLYLDFDRPLDDSELDRLREAMRERGKGKPLQHLLGEVEFFDHTFLCDERALIPRPETEELVAWLVDKEWPAGVRILDMGCGTGAMGLSLGIACREQHPEVVLADVSPLALGLAKENSDHLSEALDGVEFRLVETDLFARVEGTFHLIVANLPYLSEADMGERSREVAEDPELALRGGEKGTELMERFVREVRPFLEPGGLIAMEFGAGQDE
ncbi:MAG: HemK/PrmC family methyltransferase, partial [Verrucomicrobiota bacterium]